MKKVNTLDDIALVQDKSHFLVLNDDLVEHFVTVGVTGNFLTDLVEKFPKLKKEIPLILGISREYINAFPDNTILPPRVAKSAILVGQLCIHGFETFDDKEKFQDWLGTKCFALGGERPLEMMKSEEGILQIHQIIGRIEHGIYS